MLESTMAGSLPKPDWLAEPEKLWAPWRFQGEALTQAQERAAAEWIKHQVDAGIDIVTNCGMVPIPYDTALGKIRSLAAGAALVRNSL